MSQYASQTLGKIVSDHFKAASVLSKHHLDFCCGGKRTLKEACAVKNINTEEVEKELEAVISTNGDGPDFKEMRPTLLISYILLHHHFYIQQHLPLIQEHLNKVAKKHGNRFPYMIKVSQLFSELGKELLQHMRKEEAFLFPAIREIDGYASDGKSGFAHLTAPMMVMEQEHETAGKLMESIRSLTNDFSIPEEACTTFRLSLLELKEFENKLHEHVHLENNILFDKIRGIITEKNEPGR